jgi:hypothetical protein
MKNFAERHYGRLIFAIWLITSLFLLWVMRDSIAAFKVGDPDDALRVVQVRDWLAGQGWSNVTQYRMNLPDGGPMHWSRLVDIPIAAAILMFRPWLGQYGAEQAAAAIIPLLTYGVVLTFYAAAVRRTWGALPALVAAATFFLILPAMSQLLPMRIDHHGWQLALFCVGLWALFDPVQSRKSAIIMGVAMALWLEISVEGLPFAVIVFGILALRWFLPAWRVSGHERDIADGAGQLVTAVLTFAVSLVMLFAITENWTSAANFCDGLSPFHLASAGAVAAVLVSGVALLHLRILKPAVWTKLAICAVAALAGAATLLSIAPQCAGDTFATLDPLVRTYWFDRGAEGLPLWKLQVSLIIQPLVGLSAGAVACLWLWRGDKTQTPATKFSIALLFIGCALVGSFVSRTIVYALLIGAMVLAPMAVALFTKADAGRTLLPRLGWRLVAVALLMPAILGQNLLAFAPKQAVAISKTKQQKQAEFMKAARWCQSPDAARMLNRLPTAHIMAPLDTSPSILLFTKHTVVATGHHRNEAAMADVIRTFIGSADQAAAILKKRRIDYVLTCDGSFELEHYAERKPTGFAAQLHDQKLPNWMVPQPDIGPFHLYKIDWSKR